MKGLVSIASRKTKNGAYETKIKAPSAELLDAILNGMSCLISARREVNGAHVAIVISRRVFDRFHEPEAA